MTVGLNEEGFDVLTEIDVKERLKKIFDIDFRRYKILGTCNPPFAYKALTAGNKIRAKLHCDVFVQEISNGQVKVTAIDPLASIQAVENPKLKKLAAEIGNTLKTVTARA